MQRTRVRPAADWQTVRGRSKVALLLQARCGAGTFMRRFGAGVAQGGDIVAYIASYARDATG